MSQPADVVTAYMKAFEAADAPGLAGLFAEDGAIMAPPMPTIRGRAAIESTLAAVFGAIGVRVDEVNVERVRELGDMAFVEARSRELVTNLAEGTCETHDYRELFCLERHDGDWTIASYMFNTAPQ